MASRVRNNGSPIPLSFYYQSFLDSNDAIAITGVDGIIRDVNQAFIDLYGYPREEVVGQSTRVIKSDHSTGEMYQYMWRRIRDPKIGFWKGEIINRKKDGSEVTVLLSITPIRSNRDIVGYMGIAIDITERKELESFREIYETVVRHDLKAPLAGIIGFAQLMRDGYTGDMTQKQRSYLRRIIHSGRLMLDIINTSLDVEKIRRGRLVVNKSTLDFMKIVWNSADAMMQNAKKWDVRIDVRLAGETARRADHLRVPFDRLQTQRAVDNLVKNAIEAAPKASTVTLSVLDRTNKFVFSAHNAGPPIPADVQERMFHPFSTYGKHGGTGLGVYGVKLAVEAQGGTVTFQSDDSGTLFTICLPKTIEKESRKSPRRKKS